MTKKKAIAKNSIVCGTYYLSARENPSTESDVVGYFTQDTELDVLKEQEEWAMVTGKDKNGNDLSGWVLNKFLK